MMYTIVKCPTYDGHMRKRGLQMKKRNLIIGLIIAAVIILIMILGVLIVPNLIMYPGARMIETMQ